MRLQHTPADQMISYSWHLLGAIDLPATASTPGYPGLPLGMVHLGAALSRGRALWAKLCWLHWTTELQWLPCVVDSPSNQLDHGVSPQKWECGKDGSHLCVISPELWSLIQQALHKQSSIARDCAKEVPKGTHLVPRKVFIQGLVHGSCQCTS